MRTRKRLVTKRNPKKISNLSVKRYLESLRRKRDDAWKNVERNANPLLTANLTPGIAITEKMLIDAKGGDKDNELLAKQSAEAIEDQKQ